MSAATIRVSPDWLVLRESADPAAGGGGGGRRPGRGGAGRRPPPQAPHTAAS